jgi:D-3-phosphoglycerate dehydrogenase
LTRHAADADVVWLFGGSRVLTAHNLGLLGRCGAIVRTGSGTDNVPVAAATELGIVVANTPDALTDAVSDHAIGLLFAALRRIAAQDRAVRAGIWDRYRAWPGGPLRGRTLGLVGFGRIAQFVARKMSGFEMTVLAYDPLERRGVRDTRGAPADLDKSSPVPTSSRSLPLTPQTHLIDEGRCGG